MVQAQLLEKEGKSSFVIKYQKLHYGKFFFYKCRFVTEYKREWEANFFSQNKEMKWISPPQFLTLSYANRAELLKFYYY